MAVAVAVVGAVRLLRLLLLLLLLLLCCGFGGCDGGQACLEALHGGMAVLAGRYAQGVCFTAHWGGLRKAAPWPQHIAAQHAGKGGAAHAAPSW